MILLIFSNCWGSVGIPYPLGTMARSPFGDLSSNLGSLSRGSLGDLSSNLGVLERGKMGG